MFALLALALSLTTGCGSHQAEGAKSAVLHARLDDGVARDLPDDAAVFLVWFDLFHAHGTVAATAATDGPGVLSLTAAPPKERERVEGDGGLSYGRALLLLSSDGEIDGVVRGDASPRGQARAEVVFVDEGDASAVSDVYGLELQDAWNVIVEREDAPSDCEERASPLGRRNEACLRTTSVETPLPLVAAR